MVRPKRPILELACRGYLALLMAVWLLIRFAGDRWWPATLLLFGPRWPLAVPPILCLPAALIRARHRRAILLWTLTAVLVVGPVMGFCLPLHRAAASPAAFHLCLLTCNVHGDAADDSAMRDLIAATRPDVLCFQECVGTHHYYNIGGRTPFFIADGELRIESRYPLRRVRAVVHDGFLGSGSVVEYDVTTPVGTFPLFNTHLASPHTAFSSTVRLKKGADDSVEANSDTRARQVDTVATAAASAGPSGLLAGDFNLPADSPLFRNALSNLHDCFADAGLGFGYTYYSRLTAVRIDHVMTGPAWRCTDCHPASSVGCPHRPLLAELQWTPPPS